MSMLHKRMAAFMLKFPALTGLFDFLQKLFEAPKHFRWGGRGQHNWLFWRLGAL